MSDLNEKERGIPSFPSGGCFALFILVCGLSGTALHILCRITRQSNSSDVIVQIHLSGTALKHGIRRHERGFGRVA